MAFECVLLPDQGYSDKILGPEDCLLNILIGYDDEISRQYFLLVSLSPPGDCREITFALATYNETGDHIRTILNGNDAALLIPKHCKPMVRSHLMSATHHLIERHRPNQMFMTSIDMPLPAQAETKYDQIAAIAAENGYEVRKSDIGNGQKFWWMELRLEHTIPTRDAQ